MLFFFSVATNRVLNSARNRGKRWCIFLATLRIRLTASILHFRTTSASKIVLREENALKEFATATQATVGNIVRIKFVRRQMNQDHALMEYAQRITNAYADGGAMVMFPVTFRTQFYDG